MKANFRSIRTQVSQPASAVESCAGQINPRGLRVLRVRVRGGRVLNLLRGGSGLYLVRVRGGRGMRNSLCGYFSVEPKHMNLISSKIAQHVDV